MDYDNISEIDYLNHYRRAIKKNDFQNRKFRIKTKPYWKWLIDMYTWK